MDRKIQTGGAGLMPTSDKIEAVKSMIRAYFPAPEFFICDHFSGDQFLISVMHIKSQRAIIQVFDMMSIEYANSIRFSVENMSKAMHKSLTAYGHSNACTANQLSGPMEPWWSLYDSEEILALIAVSGYQFRYRHVQGTGDELGHRYYLVKPSHLVNVESIVHEVSPSFLTLPIEHWRIFLSQIIDRSK